MGASISEEVRDFDAKQLDRALTASFKKALTDHDRAARARGEIGLKRRLENLRDEELARAPAGERERLRGLLDAYAARLLHEPIRRLKAEEDPARKLDRVEAIRHLFDLDKE